MVKVHLNVYERILLHSILDYEGDLVQMRNYLSIFSSDFNKVYDFAYSYYQKFKAPPSKEIISEEFDNLDLIEGNSLWALEEQKKFYLKVKYKNMLISATEELEKRDFDNEKVQRILAQKDDLKLDFEKAKDFNELMDYISFKAKKIRDLGQFSLWMGAGIMNPSFNMIFANSHNGKTMFSYKFAAELFRIGKKVMFLSPEMNWKKSILEIYSFVTEKAITKDNMITPAKFKKLEEFIHIPQDAIYDVETYIDTRYREFDIIIVDSYYEFAQGGEGAGDDNGKLNALTSFLVKVPLPVFVTTQAKPEVINKKIHEVTLYDTYYNKKGSVAGDYVGFVRFDKDRGILTHRHLKGRLKEYNAQELQEVVKYSIGNHNGIFAEVDNSQNKFL